MSAHPRLAELLEFPCDYIFKTFGPADSQECFVAAVLAAVGKVVPVSRDALRLRNSRQGTYVCVSLVVRLHNAHQLERIYLALREVPGTRYLL